MPEEPTTLKLQDTEWNSGSSGLGGRMERCFNDAVSLSDGVKVLERPRADSCVTA